MLSRNFKASEFFKKGSAGVTTLNTVMNFQGVRDSAGMPVTIKGSYIEGEKTLLTYADLSGNKDSTAKAPFRHATPVDAFAMPVYGSKAALADSAIEFISKVSKGGTNTFSAEVVNGRISGAAYVALLAVLQLGYREGEDNNNVFGAELRLNRVPWCALLYHWLLKNLKTVCPSAVFENYRYSGSYSNSRYTFEHAPVTTRNISEIEPGYAVVWVRNNHGLPDTGPGRNKRAGHTGVCVYNDKVRQILITIEGNNKDGVQLIARYWRNINSRNLEFAGGCTYIRGVHEMPFVLPREGTWSGSVQEDLGSNYE